MTASGSIPPHTLAGRYRIETLLGAGGMGDVYAARDTQLDRRIALKVLSPERATDAARVQRFVREAQLASSLNHPAIVSVHDAGTATLESRGTIHYLAMELVDGQTLDVWSRSVRDLAKVTRVLAAIADGLARAHAGGIVHRDLKPQNVIVGRDGHPRILDFGIAKLMEPEEAPKHTDTAPANAMGTAEYMSPEQVEGLAVDSRSDIFSFGALMYQALSGVSPFRRATPVESMHAVLHDEPRPLVELKPHLSSELQRIVRKCLTKDREERYQSIKDVAIDLRDSVSSEAAPVYRRRGFLWPAFGALIVLAIVAAILRPLSHELPAMDLIAKPNTNYQPVMLRLTNSGNIRGGAVTPDGNYIVYATSDGENQTLWVKQIATGTSVRILPPAPVYYVDISVSDDGNYVYYSTATRAEPNIMDLRRIPVLGGESQLVSHEIESDFTLSPDSKRVAFIRFNAFERLYKFTVANIEEQTEVVLQARRYPSLIGSLAWEPNGKAITFIGPKNQSGPLAPALYSIDIETKRVTPIPAPDWKGIGSVVWLRDGSGLLATVYEPQQPRQIWFLPKGSTAARKITSDISKYGAISVTSDSRSFVAHRSDFTANLWLVDLDGNAKPRALTTGLGNCYGADGVRWLHDRRIVFTNCVAQALGVMTSSDGETRELLRGYPYWNPAVSPDGKSLALVTNRSGAEEIWVMNLLTGELRQVTHNAPVGHPTWSPDSQWIYFMSRGPQQWIWRTSLDGRVEPVMKHPTNSPSISPDGKWILCRYRSTDPSTELWRTAMVPLEKTDKPVFLDLPRHGGPPRPQWYGDGSRVAYVDYADGVANIWLQAIRGGAPRQVTHFDSGEIPAYDISPDGKSIAISHGEIVNDLVLIRDFRSADSR